MSTHSDSAARPSIYEAAGGAEAMHRIARAWHDLAVADPIVGHAFEQGFHLDHTERMAAYLSEALGGPPLYTQHIASGAVVLRMRAGNGSHPDFDDAGIQVFARALERAAIEDPEARRAIVEYWAWMTRGPMAAHPDSPDQVDPDAPLQRWDWDGPWRG